MLDSKRPNCYTEFSIDLNAKLKTAKIPRILFFDISHLATSCYSHENFERKFRNMLQNVTLTHQSFNRGEMSAFERFFLKSAKHANANKSMKMMTREFFLIHDDSIEHPLGLPLFIIVIVSFIYENGFDTRIFFLPNAPLKVNYEFFEITLRQLEDNFDKFLLNEENLQLLMNRDFHKNKQYSDVTISNEQIKHLLQLSREQLKIDPLITGHDC